MADLDRIGPLKPAVPAAKRKERQAKPRREPGTPEPDRDRKSDETPGSDGSTHQVDEYA